MTEPAGEKKTLLQQIREKEEEVGRKVKETQAEADALVIAAQDEAQDLLCTAEKNAKVTAEQVYWKERGRTETEISELKRSAELARETVAMQGARNLPAAAEQLVRYVTME